MACDHGPIIGPPKEPDRSLARGWRWLLGLAAATAAVVLLVALPILRAPTALMVQLAMLDTAGGTRGTSTNDTAALQGMWKGVRVQTFSNAGDLEAWRTNWPAGGSAGEKPAPAAGYSDAGPSSTCSEETVWASPAVLTT